MYGLGPAQPGKGIPGTAQHLVLSQLILSCFPSLPNLGDSLEQVREHPGPSWDTNVGCVMLCWFSVPGVSQAVGGEVRSRCMALPGRGMGCSADPWFITAHLLRLRASLGEALIIAFPSKANSKEHCLRASSMLLKPLDGILWLSLCEEIIRLEH